MNNVYTRSDFAQDLAAHVKLPARQSKQAVDYLLKRLTEVLTRGSKIEFRGFGVFVPRRHKPRPGHDFKTQGICTIPARTVVCFRAGKKLNAQLNA